MFFHVNVGRVVKLTFLFSGLKGCAVKSPADNKTYNNNNKNIPKAPNKYNVEYIRDTSERNISSESLYTACCHQNIHEKQKSFSKDLKLPLQNAYNSLVLIQGRIQDFWKGGS